MNYYRHIPLTLVLLISGFGSLAQTPARPKARTPARTKAAREADPQKKEVALALDMTEKQLKGFYLTLTTLIRGGKKDNNVMISLAAPGIMIEPELKSKDVEDRKYISKMLDLSSPKSPFFSMSTKRLSRSYGDIMDFGVPVFKTNVKPKVPKELQADYDLTDPTVEDGPMQKYANGLGGLQRRQGGTGFRACQEPARKRQSVLRAELHLRRGEGQAGAGGAQDGQFQDDRESP